MAVVTATGQKENAVMFRQQRETDKKIIEQQRKSRGLGDTIAKMTKAVGIKPCGGCKKRQEILNKAVPYRTKALSTENTEGTERAKAKT